MISQILTVVFDFLLTGKMGLFLLGLIFGGMLTVSSERAFELSETLVSWWELGLTALTGQ